ncbi:MAG TPA: GLUG motif-containing protein [Candidatus Hydrogenedentes bacterium]|nr:GLUG motif-containing protein [Candidatus Hydrogenedentota bacterium]
MIRNLTINRPNEDYSALIGGIDESAIIQNFGLEECQITGNGFVGGIFGMADIATISECFVKGSIHGRHTVGGIIGYGQYCTITQSFFSGTITGASMIGGIAGYAGPFCAISDCCVIGAVFQGAALIGNMELGCSLSKCYAAALGADISLSGGLINTYVGTQEIVDCFWDMDVYNPVSTQILGIGLNTSAMMQSSTFITAGWDFSNEDGNPPIWTMIDGESYPRLVWSTLADARYTLTIDTEHGTVESNPVQSDYAPFSLVWMSAEPDPGYIFAGWTGDGLGNIALQNKNPYPIVMGSNQEITAVFLLDSPIVIHSIEELQKIGRDNEWPLHWEYVLEEDLDAAITEGWNGGKGFIPLGWPYMSFQGRFEGSGHVIRNLFINSPQGDIAGLFGTIGENGEVHDLGLIGGAVSGSSYVGGLAGNNYGTVTNCYTATTVSGIEYVGGLLGYSKEGIITGCYAAGEVNSEGNHIGGLIGASRWGAISECFVMGTVSGNEYVGGLIGRNESAASDCFMAGTVFGNTYVGGLIGESISGATVTKSYATGDVSGQSCIGGLLGQAHSEQTISECYSTCSVSGDHSVGGLVGVAWLSAISNCYASGNVSGNYDVGGLVGYLRSGDPPGTVQKSFSIGAVSGNTSTGGLVGLNEFGAVESCFWDTETSNQDTSSGGTGLPTAQMQTKAIFTSAGWDFDTIWGIDEGISYSYLLAFNEQSNEGETEGSGDEFLSADQNNDHVISLSELLRTIQFYNAGGYCCQAGTEDGYAPGTGDTSCGTHNSDYNPANWVISLSELLRLVQLYNSGAYHACPGSEDGFCPGL